MPGEGPKKKQKRKKKKKKKKIVPGMGSNHLQVAAVYKLVNTSPRTFLNPSVGLSSRSGLLGS